MFNAVTDLANAKQVKEIYIEAFPVGERIPFQDFFSKNFKGYQLYSLTINEKVIAMVHFKNLKNFVHINYIAVEKKCRSKGYGSLILSKIKEMFNNKPIVVDIEELDEKSDNCKEKIRRKAFYKKNGFEFGKYNFWWEGFFMTYMAYGNVDGKEFMKYIVKIFPTIKNIKKIEIKNF